MRALALCALFAVLSLLAALPAVAGLEGRWVFSYRTPDGLAVTAPCRITGQGSEFTAKATYALQGQVVADAMEGTVDQSGTVVFTVQRAGMLLKHKGTLSRDGKIITGWYNEPSGAGTFTLERAANVPGHPVLTGEWTYVFFEPGAPPYRAVCTMESFRGGVLAGTIRYQGVSVEAAFKGSVDTRGNVRFTMEEGGAGVVHTGTLSGDGKTISGRWRSDWSSGSFTITRP